MKSGKTLGPDGFPIEFYRTFSPKLLLFQCKVYAEPFKVKSLSPTMTQATISVLLTKDKDPLQCESYRPVSLLCCDYKILSIVLADRLEWVLNRIIHQDQIQFIRGRQLFSNLRRVYNVVYLRGSSVGPEVIISLDTHKAFDRVQHNYLLSSLKSFGFGPSFCSWVNILYSRPQASIQTNNNMSEPFPLFRRTRQGCPLSPLLFNISIELLAAALRKDADIKSNQIYLYSTFHTASVNSMCLKTSKDHT